MAEYSMINCLRTDKPMKKNGKYPIYLRIRIRGKETKIPTGIDVAKDRWDAKYKNLKEKSLLIQLKKKRDEIDRYINRKLADGQELTLEMVKDFCSGKKKAVKPESQSFFDYYLEFVERKRKENLASETIRVYMTTYHILKEFKSEIRISDISLSLIEDFDDYMARVRGNASGGRNPKHKTLRAVILDIEKHNIPIENPYKWFKMPQANTKEIYLDKNELEAMRKLRHTLPHNSTMYKVLQMYLFSCYCGLRFSDVMDLKWSHIDFENNIIKKEMIKTRSEVITPLLRRARAVILEISDGKKLLSTSKNVFYKYSDVTVNQTLSKLTKLAKIEKHITYHSSRHTFATLLVQDGTDIYKISKFLGHKSINMTQRYLKYDLSIAINTAKEIKTFD